MTIQLLILFLLLGLVSCATIPNIELCHDEGDSALCVTTLSNEKRIPEDWSQERVGRFSMDSEGWAKLKKFILKVCEIASCEKESGKIEEQIDDLESSLVGAM